MIKVQNLVRKFGDFQAVKDISFEVQPGELFAFLGPNGAGKTTTIKMLTTLLNPTSGSIQIDGLDPAKHQNEVRSRFGIVFQDPSVDTELTAWENMDLHGVLYGVPRKVRHERTEQLLKLFELWEKKDQRMKTFSGGMKRRLEIARGFLHTPKILFLDEPTLGLDPQSRNQLWTHVKALNESEKVTVFLTTHYMDEAERVAQRIAVIDHGAIVAQGSPAELKQQTQTDTLEAAFLKLTGSAIRDESANSMDQMRQMARMWGNRR
jgi:ABC-2 type transport system ATP-binding protein